MIHHTNGNDDRRSVMGGKMWSFEAYLYKMISKFIYFESLFETYSFLIKLRLLKIT